MTHVALTAKYRPQTFAQVAGQETLKAILSRASLEGRVAPAYLFSGTRGVGKTTLARIFAKALNCRTAPTAEPCNECDQCRAVTSGSAVDVVEIDGASNRGIDDVRRLREVVGYAPMEGRYKIFIIDEAHMLSREAFNALLKTLEEPPARVTFIMATTEPHKFPATIISRCQHYVFKRLPEGGLVTHLCQVLDHEGVDYDDSAVRLIARRGAGSVRDSMSLLGQVLALGEGRLSEDAARGVLGLAGQEVFVRMLEAFKNGDSLALSAMLRELLDQGLDMGFFLRELASLWRNLFMLRQSDEAALAVVELPENEARLYLEASRGFSLQHIHACWQMTLEGQRRVLTSLEPALALELLLLNLAMLPRLLSLESLSALGRKGGPAGAGPAGGAAPAGGSRPAPGREPASGGGVQAPALPVQERSAPARRSVPEARGTAAAADPGPEAEPDPESEPDEAAIQQALNELSVSPADAPAPVETETAPVMAAAPMPDLPADVSEPLSALGVDEPSSAQEPEAEAPFRFPDWDEVLTLSAAKGYPSWLTPLLRRVSVSGRNGCLEVAPLDAFTVGRLKEPEVRVFLDALLKECCGTVPPLVFTAPTRTRKSQEEVKTEVMSHPLVKEMQERFGARYLDSGQIL